MAAHEVLATLNQVGNKVADPEVPIQGDSEDRSINIPAETRHNSVYITVENQHSKLAYSQYNLVDIPAQLPLKSTLFLDEN